VWSRLIERLGGITARLPAVALIGLGLAALYWASGLSFGSVRQPGSGFYPTLVSLALIAFAAVAAARSAPLSHRDVPAGGHGRVWLVVAALAAYAWAVTPIGFLLCTAALLILLLRGVGRVAWWPSVAAAVIASAGCYAVFTRLGVPLPAGVLGL
jgi:putative tricarboxylic transport membrane protein